MRTNIVYPTNIRFCFHPIRIRKRPIRRQFDSDPILSVYSTNWLAPAPYLSEPSHQHEMMILLVYGC